MLNYWKDGKEIIVPSVGEDGREGQVLILGEKVDWGKTSFNSKNPLTNYPYLSVFTIVLKNKADEYYVLRDSHDKTFIIHWHTFTCNVRYLYDITTWLEFNTAREAEKISRKQRKIEQLEGHVDMLKDILIKQGPHIVTEKQAEALGISTEGRV